MLGPIFEHKGRSALAVLGIACGTALYVAISIINAATLEHFAASVGAIAGKATLSVGGPETGFPEETLEVVEKVAGVDRVVPMVHARARVGTRGEQSVTVLGVDMLRESAVRGYAREGEDLLDDPLEFLNQADSVLVSRAFAAEHHLVIGAPLTLTTADGPHAFTVRGVLAGAGATSAFGGRVVLMDIDAARVSFGKEGRTDRLDVVAKRGADAEALERDVAAAVGPALRAERPSEQTEAFRKMVAAYQEVLAGLARLALVVAVFLVGSTMSVAVAERRKEIGVLRAIGATRAAILAMFLATSLALGVAGALLGLPLGRALAEVLVGAVSRSVALTFATPIEPGTLRLPLDVAVAALASGAVSSLIGGILPALRASQVPCVEALRPKDVESAQAPRTAIAPCVLGFALLAYVGVASALEIDWRSPLLRGSTLTVAYVGGALVAPWLSAAALRALARIVGATRLSRVSFVHLALASIASTSRRTTGATSLIAALMLVLLMTATHASFRGTLSTSTAKMLTADLWISENGLFMNGDSAPIRADLKTEIDAVPGVDRARGGAYAERMLKLHHEGRTLVLKAWDRVDPRLAPIVTTDDSGPAAVRALFDGAAPTVLVSENFVAHFGKRRGDHLTLDTPSGPVDFVIGGVILEFASPEGTLYVSRDVYRRLWRDEAVTMFYAFVTPGEEPARVRDRIDAALGQRRGVITAITSEARTMTARVLDDAFAYTRAIEVSALVVGLFGLLGTMLVTLLERRRELGVLRAIGASRAQIGAMVVFEIAMVGAAASVTALVLGTYLARVWLAGAVAHDVGWPITVEIPAVATALTLASGVLVGIVVGAVGASRASRVPLREALAHE